MTKSTADDHAQMIEDCEARESKLSEWEHEFIDSIGRQLHLEAHR